MERSDGDTDALKFVKELINTTPELEPWGEYLEEAEEMLGKSIAEL